MWRLFKGKLFQWLAWNLHVTPTIHGDPARLDIHKSVETSNAIFNLSSGKIRIDRDVIIGHNVMFLTGIHDRRTGGAITTARRDIHIKPNTIIYSGSIIIAPCVIGAYSVVRAGSIVRGTHSYQSVISGDLSRSV